MFPPQSVFLAGPTPRDKQTPSWRPEAISILKKLKYKGLVFLPEFKVRKLVADYDAQVEWEHEGLTRSQIIVFWVPRELKTMPAFTTNVEFGRFAHQHNVLYGRPSEAPGNRYLDWYYKKCHANVFCPNGVIYTDLEHMLKQTL